MRVESSFASAYLQLGDLLLMLGDLQGAQSAYQRVQVIQPINADGFLRSAEAYREFGQLDAAKASVAKAVGLAAKAGVGHVDGFNPASAASSFAVAGHEYALMQQLPDAISAYRQAVILNPADSTSRSALIHTELEANQSNWALGDAEAAVRALPSSGEVLVALGDVYSQRGDSRTGLAFYYRAVAVQPDYAQAYFAIAHLAKQDHQNLTDRIVWYERGLALTTKDRGVNGLALQYGNHHIWEAVARYTELEQAAPQELWPQLALAGSYDGWAKEEDALAAFLRATAIAPTDGDLYCQIGLRYENLWRYDDARAMLDACLAMSGPPPAELAARAAAARIIADARNVYISSPFANGHVNGQMVITGSAEGANFRYYKLEYHPVGGDQTWRLIGSLIFRPVDQGILGTWDTRGLPSGDYVLRVVVVDSTGNISRPYEVIVAIQ
jgi:tetratricopeptide (TPR) repeat protein